ncbi:hypothetical protein HQH39_04760 [Escherichia coli]|nr:hypothetical protein [Escherichia coli]
MTSSLPCGQTSLLLQMTERLALSDCIDSLEVRKKPGGHWIIRDLAGLDLVGLASL